jgi:HlyD family secretion protein
VTTPTDADAPRLPLPPPIWARGPLASPRLRRFTRVSGPGLLVLTCVLAACTSTSSAPPPQTARVERTTVSSAVTSSGALAASTEQNLGFIRSGQLTTVDVKVGDRVTAGQVLATQDDTTLRRTLEQQQAQLDQQRAVLAQVVNSTQVQGTENTVEQAQAILDATEDQVQATKDADDTNVERAEKQLDFDEDARDDARRALRADQAACAAAPAGGTSTTGTFSRTALPSTGLSAMSALTGAGGSDPKNEPDDDWGDDSAEGAADAPSGTGTGTGTGTPGATDTGTFSALTAPVGSPSCDKVQSDQTAVANADRQVVLDRTALDQARQQRDVDEAAGQVSIENARQSLVSAQNAQDSAVTDRPSLIAQQQAGVDRLDAAVRQAQQDVDDTVLRAPVDGVVAALNGAVGEYVGASTGTSALAPGSGAAIPGTGGTAASATNQSPIARPGGTQFIVLDGADTFQVVVPFEETDATRVAPNQNVDVTFDAVPDLVRRGTVLAVSPSATANSGVISYYATVLLTETDPRLRDGLSAQAAVRTEEVRDVPSVPNAAVRRDGSGRTTVTVINPDGSRRVVPFQAGAVGDTRTQVLSGLAVGDEVDLSPSR